MRKVLLKVFLIICFICGIAGSSVNVRASETIRIYKYSGGEYTYEKIIIDGVVYWIEYDENGVVTDIFPDSCGGPSLGGH